MAFFRPAWAGHRRVVIAGATAVVLAAGGTAAGLATAGGSHAAGSAAPAKARLAASSCTGPAGAAYIAVAGYQAFDAVDTSNCNLVQQYNVGDHPVPDNGPEDFNYDSTDEGIAAHGALLYFADTGNNSVSVIDSSKLDVDNYESPAETDIKVGQDPQALAVSPDGSQVWVADTGPQTGEPTLGAISVISAATDTVTATIALPSTDPRAVAFSPDGTSVYVTTSKGLYVYRAATRRLAEVIPGLASPEGVAVSPDGKTVYVAGTNGNVVYVIKAGAARPAATVKVGELPWQLAVSPDGTTIYVADGDSNAISVISAATDKVTGTISDAGDPVSLAVTPDGSQLWVGGLTSGVVTVFSTSTDDLVGTFSVGYGGEPNSGDGEEPTGIVLTTTPTPGS